MVRIAFILLCHKLPDAIIAQAELLAAGGDCVAIHFDRSAPAEDYARLQEALGDNPNITFAKKRVKGGWGEWSLVEGTLSALRAARETFPDATHFYFISGDCMPIKPRGHIVRYLENNPYDFVEHHDFLESDWIKTGLKEDRLIYRHYFNEREQKALFYRALNLQRALGLKRDIPSDLRIFIGSQWCVLRRETLDKILDFVAKRRDVIRFFRTTWIPDETFFQTLVMHLVPRAEVKSQTLTLLAFSDYGLPMVQYDDHYELLRTQSALFTRKVSPNARKLKAQLSDLFLSADDRIETADTAIPLYSYITKRGRIGRRFTGRFWERGGQIGRGHDVLVVVCKKWHVAKRFVDGVRQIDGPEALGYVFDEEGDALPALGGIESSKEKRGRHRRAFLKMLFEYHDTERLVICLDPANIDTLRDIQQDDCGLRVLEIRCTVDDAYMLGHAKRIGMIADVSDVTVASPLLMALHRQFKDESDALRDLNLTHFYSVDDRASLPINVENVARFLSVPPEQATTCLRDHRIFKE
ncbi:hypothetical protein FHS89_002879 [Rubricella aquisinus]|uniref:Peptide O-xylosyltransferase n=1 Tax=Rubricella aquisinus TaxID=2028108 RepID=A0A840X7Z7_9RHOB|nr:DUF5928 domain-containing protein [Rubricella aquisinus]MBB5516837.1 hypothetical protein [Rubricella aquisinus]